MNEGTLDFLNGIQDIPIRKNFAWRICRQTVDISLFQFKVEQQRIPGWTGFNGIVCKQDIPRKSFAGYCQVVDASPMQLSTVYTLLTKCSIIIWQEQISAGFYCSCKICVNSMSKANLLKLGNRMTRVNDVQENDGQEVLAPHVKSQTSNLPSQSILFFCSSSSCETK